MRQLLYETLPELLDLLLSSLLAFGLSVAGVYLEHFAYITAQGGQSTVGLWAVVPGAVCLGFGYLLATDRVAPKITEVRHRLADQD